MVDSVRLRGHREPSRSQEVTRSRRSVVRGKSGRLRAAGATACAAGIVMFAGAGPVHAAVLAASGLEANANAAPLGIDDPTPTLSWRLASSDRGVLQSKYQVVVATAAAKAVAGTGDVWDSGQVASDRNSAVYAGPALASRTRYYWSVRSWTGPVASDWAPAGWFETAYLSPSEWKGTWIAGPSRLAGVPTPPEGGPGDDLCLQGSPSLPPPPAPGSKVLRVNSITGFFAGKTVALDSGSAQESVKIDTIGTPASSTTAAAPVSAGDTNVKLTSVANLATGTPLNVDGETVTISSVGSAA